MRYRVTCDNLALSGWRSLPRGAEFDSGDCPPGMDFERLLVMKAIAPTGLPVEEHVEFNAVPKPTRKELNMRAAELGIENPEKMRNIEAVEEAIAAAEAALGEETPSDDDDAEGETIE